MLTLLLPVHVTANLVWIGSILAVVLVLAKGPGDARQRGATARLLYRTLAVPGFVVSLTMGVVKLALDPTYYFKVTHFMHAKLALVAVIIGLHHVIGARARKMEDGEAADAGMIPVLGQLVAVLAFATVLVVLNRIPN